MDDDGHGSSSSSPLHVVICPWLAFGHLLPCLDIAERLASRGHRVSFVSTPRNIARLPPVRPAVAPLVDFVALPLPHVDGLPEGAESTNDVPHDQFELLREAFDGLAAPFSEFLRAACVDGAGSRPDWLIVDTFHHWAAASAVQNKVPCVMLLLGAATVIAAWATGVSEHTADAVGKERSAAEAPSFETERRKLMITQNASGMTVAERYFLTLTRSNLVAIRSCAEWEPESVAALTTLAGKPVVTLGLLPPSPEGGRGVSKEDAAVRWLDAQPANKSVVYVALGSEVPLRAEQVHELALGLELSGARFLWALRKPSGVPDADILPPGFEERTRDRGLVVTGWVPQISVLAHDAVAAFLTHCGWNSTIEGLLFGHPLIMLPISSDQGPNARLMEGRKVGMQVPRNESDGSFTREDVAAMVRAVAVEEDGRRVFTANAKKMQEIVADGACHERCIDGLIQQLRSYKA
ncbi:putative UDP-rhamnose:rhamnosyltransferase 1 [Triticum urartu]|uniref:Glycosyltransferase n=1 Tax=Triticum urartu TaxID=4572 RepID=A0A8R7PZD6_TRIUA|nr:putative UDP-rhamnose:rhamnosyltransferase 1 [Triticum urartu]